MSDACATAGGGILLASVTASLGLGIASAAQASQPSSPSAGRIAAGSYHTCAIRAAGSLRCWGYGGYGALGYGNTMSVGLSETPASAGPVDLGRGRSAMAVTAGDYHTCAILDNGSVRCWGYGGEGRLGYGGTQALGDTAATVPAKLGAVNLGAGVTAKAISAGGAHTCAILDNGSVKCWGFGFDGQLGDGKVSNVGDTPATVPARIAPVDLGAGRTAHAISAGGNHTCAILDDGTLRCWGFGGEGALGYGNNSNVGDTAATVPGALIPVDLGPGRKARAISAGGTHTCAILDDGSVRCWGNNVYGQLGLGDTGSVGSEDTPATVMLGGHAATAISAGGHDTCAILDDGGVRCWGYGGHGDLGYGDTSMRGDTPATVPAMLPPVNLGSGRTAAAISAGKDHSCALLDDGSVRCWGDGAQGELGYCNASDVGSTPATLPGDVGPVNLSPGDGGARCAGHSSPIDPRRVQAARARALRRCLVAAKRHTKVRRTRARRRCLRRYGRTPGRITNLQAQALSGTTARLSFDAPGADGSRPPAAQRYVVKQSNRPIRREHDFVAAQSLCGGNCRFEVGVVGTEITLEITHLRRRRVYFYAVAARDNVSGRLGPRSPTARIRTR